MTLEGRVAPVPPSSGSAGFGDGAPLDLSALPAATQAQIADRLISAEFQAWAHTAARVRHCAKRVRLVG